MKAFALALCVALAACGPEPEDEPSGANDPSMSRVEVTRQTLNGVGVRIRLTSNWALDWDTFIKRYDPVSGGGYFPAGSYETPTFNMYVSENLNGANPLYGGAFAPYSTTATSPSCGHLGGITKEITQWPWLDNLTPGHTVYFWFMPRCASGYWPAFGPPESMWRYSLVVPTAPGSYYKDFFTAGFFNNKTMWRQWFQGCGGNMAQEWFNDTTLGLFQCHATFTGCLCDNGSPPGTPVIMNEATWR